MNLSEQEKQLINDILDVTELYNNMNHETQIYKLNKLLAQETYPVQYLQNLLGLKYSTAQSYFKKAKKSQAGNWMGTKMPLVSICKLCLHYEKSLEWFLKNI